MTIRLRSFFHSRSIFRFIFHFVLEAIFHNLMFECNFNSSKTVKICHRIIAFLPKYFFFLFFATACISIDLLSHEKH